jgi:peptidyl-prolyl cis-trans isomerase C
VKAVYLFLFIFFFIACSQQVEKPQETDFMAKVDGDVLTKEEFNASFSSEELKNMTPEQKQAFIDSWINLTLMAQEADEQKVSAKPEVKVKIENATKKIKANALLAKTLKDIQVDEEELFNYYRIHKNKYTKKVKQYEVQRIFCQEEALIKEVSRKIQSKELSFDQAARKYSEEDIASKSGYAGFLSQSEMPDEIWNALENLKKWHFQTVKTDKGYYIVMYHNVRTVDLGKTFPEAKPEIRKILIEQKKEKIYQQLLDRLKSEANISKNL